jgi:RNA polymerase sigma-70 factor (ECF subfamily)
MASGTNRNDGFGDTARQWAHHADLVMYARRVLGDRSDTAEDIVQEAYLRLLGLAASDEAPTGARPWLFRVVRNLAIDERRSAARRADPVAEPDILGTASLDNTESLVEHREELAEALREMASLPPRERRAIEMDQAGLGATVIATELGTTPNAVHQALFRARKRLRKTRAVAWGLIPIGLAPFALRISDPALAATITNLPPGVPVGRALPVAGIVAAAMVGSSVVVPVVDHTPVDAERTQIFVHRAAAASASTPIVNGDTPSGRTAQTSNSGPSTNSGSGSANSGKGKADEGDDDEGSRSGRRDGEDDDKRSGRNRGSDDDTPKAARDDDRGGDGRRGRDSGKTSRGGDDETKTDEARRDSRSGKTTDKRSESRSDSGSDSGSGDDSSKDDDSSSGK